MPLTPQQIQEADYLTGLPKRTAMSSLDKNPKSGGKGGVEKVSGALRNIGLGLVPDIAGVGYEGARKVSSALGNKDAYGYQDEQGNWNNMDNPFVSNDRFEQLQTPLGAGKAATEDIAGAASWALPVGKAGIGVKGFVKSIPKLAALGAAQGAAQAVGTGDNVIKGTVEGAVLNPLLGGVGKVAQKGLDVAGRGLGAKVLNTASGMKFPDIEAEVGGKFSGSRENIGNQSFAFGDVFKDAKSAFFIKNLEQPDKWVPYDTVLGDIESLGKKYEGTPGFNDFKAELKTQLSNAIDNVRKEYNSEVPAFSRQGLATGQEVLGAVPDKLPIAVLDDFRNRAGNLIGWHKTNKTGLDKFGMAVYHSLRDHVINNSPEPKRMKELMELSRAVTDIGKADKTASLIGRIGKSAKLPEGAAVGATMIASSLLGLGIPTALVDVITSSPRLMLPVARALRESGKLSDKIEGKTGVQDAIRKLGIQGFENAF